MVEILHDLIYIHMYYITRLPILLVYEVYIRSCRNSTINRSFFLEGCGSYIRTLVALLSIILNATNVPMMCVGFAYTHLGLKGVPHCGLRMRINVV